MAIESLALHYTHQSEKLSISSNRNKKVHRLLLTDTFKSPFCTSVLELSEENASINSIAGIKMAGTRYFLGWAIDLDNDIVVYISCVSAHKFVMMASRK